VKVSFSSNILYRGVSRSLSLGCPVHAFLMALIYDELPPRDVYLPVWTLLLILLQNGTLSSRIHIRSQSTPKNGGVKRRQSESWQTLTMFYSYIGKETMQLVAPFNNSIKLVTWNNVPEQAFALSYWKCNLLLIILY